MSPRKQNKSSPSPSASDGRDGRGRFARGNRLSKGNPYAVRVAKLRRELLAAVTTKDVREIVRMLVNKARKGDIVAAREILDRCIGKPIEADVEERVERMEAILNEIAKQT